MMLKGQDASHIVLGNSFAEDGFPGGRYDYCLPTRAISRRELPSDQCRNVHPAGSF